MQYRGSYPTAVDAEPALYIVSVTHLQVLHGDEACVPVTPRPRSLL